MDTGTGRFRHWAQCAVVVIVQRKKVVLKTAKTPKRAFYVYHLQETIYGFQIQKAESVLH